LGRTTLPRPPERRHTYVFDIRAGGADGIASTIVGHSSTFWDVDSYFTAMAPGAFQRTLADRRDQTKLLFQHDPSRLLGLPLEQREDAKGLYIEAALFDDQADGSLVSRHLRIAQSMGKQAYGLSFGFRTLNGRPATEDDPLNFSQMPNINRSEVYVITEVKLYEHSIVTFPADENAQIEAIRQRAHVDALDQLLDDIRERRLSPDEERLMRQIVAAFPTSPDSQAAPGPEQRTRRLEAEIALARYRQFALETRTTYV
jgi:HK97 family phage prohead protease